MICIHRWTTIKRWHLNGTYHIIQRCRRCEDWAKREIDLKELSEHKPSMSVRRIELKPLKDNVNKGIDGSINSGLSSDDSLRNKGFDSSQETDVNSQNPQQSRSKDL